MELYHIAVGHVALGRAYGVTIGPVRPPSNLATKTTELFTPAASEEA